MKIKSLSAAAILLFIAMIAGSATEKNGGYVDFNKYFLDKTLRVDYIHAGNSQSSEIYFKEMLEEPYWGGSKVNLIDTMFYGNYYFNVYDLASDKLIYSRGYSTLFWEWQATEEADHENFAACETLIMPYPRNDIRIEICDRDKNGKFKKCFEKEIDIDSYFIIKERRMQYPTYDVSYSGNPAHKVDIVLLPEGYTADEMDKFKEDCRAFAEAMFAFSPYKENRKNFNIRAVLAPSEESGTDIPGENIWKKTIMNSNFYTFDSERYLMSFDNTSIRDLASNVPYDYIYILVNSQKYGGGAIYHHYGISTTGNVQSPKVFVHEFGHLFLGLADEYVGNTSYNDMYPTDIEPWEPNITTLVNFDIKWKGMLDRDIEIPTKIDEKHPDRLGVYEGGGYASKGVYRPRPKCIMNSLFDVNDFCPVCIKAIQRQIEFYCK